MKLRIKGNSIRLRLLRSEVERFSAEGKISEEARFATGELRYSLVMADVEAIAARFEDGQITVAIPRAAARHWVTSELVGLENEQALGSGQSLSILIEKDFECIDRPNDPDRADAYPNPNPAC